MGKKIFFLIALLSFGVALGFFADTPIKTVIGFVPIEHLNVHDAVVSSNLKDSYTEKPITHTTKKWIPHYFKIQIADTSICTHAHQQFYLPLEKRWIEAQSLTPEHVLACTGEKCIRADAIELIKQPAYIYEITVEDYHTFCITPHDIVVHNIVPAVGVILTWAIGSGTVQFLGVTAYAGIVAFGTGIGLKIYKDHEKKKQKVQFFTSAGGSPMPPDDDERKRKRRITFDNNNFDNNQQPYGRYEDADYHTRHGNGHKSPRPKNGQRALDNSISYSAKHRIAIENGAFVVLNQTLPGLYHGHIREWKKLEPEMKKALKEAGLVNAKGKILK